jgi:hypothetical protein
VQRFFVLFWWLFVVALYSTVPNLLLAVLLFLIFVEIFFSFFEIKRWKLFKLFIVLWVCFLKRQSENYVFLLLLFHGVDLIVWNDNFLQQAYFKCAYECFDRRRKQEEISNCVEHCSVPVLNAQNHFENEMAKFQVSLFYLFNFNMRLYVITLRGWMWFILWIVEFYMYKLE